MAEPRAGRRLGAPSAIAVAGVAIAGWAFISYYLFHWGAHWALDLRVYRAAGHSLFHHGEPYSTLFTANRLPFTYPPFALLVLSPLSFGPLALIKALWWFLNGAALITIVYLVLTRALRVAGAKAWLLASAISAAATLAFEPLRSNLDYGQINLLLMLMVVADVTAVRGRGRGVLVGVAAAIKLTPLVYLAYFVVDRDRPSAVRGAATFAGLSALSWAVLPSESAHYWLHEAFSPSRTGPVGLVSNQSWNGLVHRAPFHAGTLGVVLWAGASVVTLVVGVLVARHCVQEGRSVEALLALALSELLVSPISWSHHWSWVVIVPVVMVSCRGARRSLLVALVGVVVVAIAEPYWWSVHGWLAAILDDSLTIAGALLLATMARDALAHQRSSATALGRPPRVESRQASADESA
jgi:alpha-1,2-mannosyltransferase